MAVFVNISRAQSLVGHLAHLEFRTRSLKGAVAFAKHHQHFIFRPTIYGDVRFLIAIEIRDCDSVRMRIAFNRKRRAWRE